MLPRPDPSRRTNQNAYLFPKADINDFSRLQSRVAFDLASVLATKPSRVMACHRDDQDMPKTCCDPGTRIWDNVGMITNTHQGEMLDAAEEEMVAAIRQSRSEEGGDMEGEDGTELDVFVRMLGLPLYIYPKVPFACPARCSRGKPGTKS